MFNLVTEGSVDRPLVRVLPGPVVSAGTVRSRPAAALVCEAALVIVVGLAVGLWDWRAGLAVAAVVSIMVFRQVATTGTSVVRARLHVRTVDRHTGWPAGWAVLVPGRTVTVDLRAGRDPVCTVPVAVPALSASDLWGVGQPPPVRAVLVARGGEQLELTGAVVIGSRPPPTPGWATVSVTDLSRTVSRSHLLVEPGEGGIWVTDLETTNGTVLIAPGAAEEEIPSRVRLFARFGSVLLLGKWHMQVLPPAWAQATGRWAA